MIANSVLPHAADQQSALGSVRVCLAPQATESRKLLLRPPGGRATVLSIAIFDLHVCMHARLSVRIFQ